MGRVNHAVGIEATIIGDGHGYLQTPKMAANHRIETSAGVSKALTRLCHYLARLAGLALWYRSGSGRWTGTTRRLRPIVSINRKKRPLVLNSHAIG